MLVFGLAASVLWYANEKHYAMKPNLTLFTCCVALAHVMRLQAQTPLPYATGFDDAGQQEGWQAFRGGEAGSPSWELLSGGAPSSPNFLWHDYVLNEHEGDTIRDWFVSPPFDFIHGARFAGLKLYVNAITGVIDPADRIGVYLLMGSADPMQASTVRLLCDLTEHVAGTSDWMDAPPCTIDPIAGECHIAILYRASTNQFTLSVDDIRVDPLQTGITDQGGITSGVQLYPNPSTGIVTIGTAQQAASPLRLRLYDTQGALVEDRPVAPNTPLELQQAAGRYSYAITDAHGAILRKGSAVLMDRR